MTWYKNQICEGGNFSGMWFNIKEESAMQIRQYENWGILKGKFMGISDILSFLENVINTR